jgi:acyl-CoA thioesterase FadM
VSWRDAGVKLGLPRVSASCDYQKPAFFEDVLTIAVTVEKVGRKSISYRFDFSNQRGEALAVGRVTAVLVRTVGHDRLESLEFPAEFRAKLEA